MRITYDTGTGEFAFDEGTLRSFGTSIEARLERHGQVVRFDGLSFGITIARNGNVTETHAFPPPGVSYRSTDQDRLTSVPVRWQPDETITLEVWIENAGMTRTARHSFTVPRPPQPYPSWVWTGARWSAPVPYPEGAGWYDWDEAARDWVPVA